MKLRFPLLTLSLLCLVRPWTQAADYAATKSDSITKVGDLLAYVMPAAAFGATALFKDGEGAWQAAETMAITGVASLAFKYAVHSRRPNGDPYSFPSGHTAYGFATAEFLQKRYGWQYGAPAFVLASFAGYSRVRAHEHYTRDVAAGAAIGFLSSFFVTTPYKGWHAQAEYFPGAGRILLSRSF